MIRFGALLVFLAFLIAALLFTEHRPLNANLPIVKADYQSCIMVRNGPVRRNAKPILNKHFSEIV